MTPQKKQLRCHSASQRVFTGILDQTVRGFILLEACVFRRTIGEYLTHLCCGRQIFDEYTRVMYVMMNVVCDECGVCGEDWEVGPGHDK